MKAFPPQGTQSKPGPKMIQKHSCQNSQVRKHLQVVEINKNWWREMRRWNWGILLVRWHNESFKSHIRHKCNCPWGKDCALKTLYQVVTNNPIPPYLDIPLDPIRIWNKFLVYWIFYNTIVIVSIIFRYMNRATLKHTTHFFMTLAFPESSTKIIVSTLA